MPSCLQPAALQCLCSVSAVWPLQHYCPPLVVETLSATMLRPTLSLQDNTHITTVSSFKMMGWAFRVNVFPVSPSQLVNLMYLSAAVIDNLVSCDVKLKAAEPSYYRHAALPSSCGQPSQVRRLQIVHVDM